MSRNLRRRNRHKSQNANPASSKDYRRLKNTLGLQPAFSQDHIEDIHHTALRVLEELGIRILNQEARNLFKDVGVQVDE
ncbi:MAG: trimethylamine methyltransferase family protein, partial [Gammaproteobacteria bacterium]|nr:trimethylamine methyltransferase family protein [Gammaproteobacteria bacterium]